MHWACTSVKSCRDHPLKVGTCWSIKVRSAHQHLSPTGRLNGWSAVGENYIPPSRHQRLISMRGIQAYEAMEVIKCRDGGPCLRVAPPAACARDCVLYKTISAYKSRTKVVFKYVLVSGCTCAEINYADYAYTLRKSPVVALYTPVGLMYGLSIHSVETRPLCFVLGVENIALMNKLL